MAETTIKCDRCGKTLAKHNTERMNGYTSLCFRPAAQPDITYCSWECAAPL